MALIGLLIGPLAWIGAHVPGASAMGIAGIGIAPEVLPRLFSSRNEFRGFKGAPGLKDFAALQDCLPYGPKSSAA